MVEETKGKIKKQNCTILKIFLIISIMMGIFFGKTTVLAEENVFSVYNVKNPSEICKNVTSGKIKVGIYNFYDKKYSMLPNTSACDNSSYFSNNLSNKKVGESYDSFTRFGLSSSSYKHYIEGINVSNNDKYQYFYINNTFQKYVNNKLSSTNTLKAGERIFFDVNIDNINVSSFKDLRISMNYLHRSSDINISIYDSITYYMFDTKGNKYGPFYLDYSELIKKIYFNNSSSEIEFYEYEIVSEKINLISKDALINKIRIFPYEKYPAQYGAFRLLSLSIDNYPNGYNHDREYITASDSLNKTRQNITNNMATNATIKWAVNETQSLNFYCGLCTGNPKKFVSNQVYYGFPYVNSIDATPYSFLSKTIKNNGLNKYVFATEYLNDEKTYSGKILKMGTKTTTPLYVYEPNSTYDSQVGNRANELNSKDYVVNSNSNYFLGQDCSSSTFYAIAKELPYDRSMAASYRYMTSPQVRLLGNSNLDYSKLEKLLRENNIVSNSERISGTTLLNYYSNYMKTTYDPNVIYDGYGLLIPGDILAKNGHVRMVTGYSSVKCNDGTVTKKYKSNFCSTHGGINADESYAIISEVRGTHVNMAKSKTEMETHVSQIDAGWKMIPDSNYTDVINLDSFYSPSNTNLISFRINKKYTFAELYGDTIPAFDDDIQIEEQDAMYLPYRYKNIDKIALTNKIEKPEVKFTLDGEGYSNIEEEMYKQIKIDHKLHGIITTNYVIEKIKIDINNNSYYVYPNLTNYYSLYHDLKDEKILDCLNKLDYSKQITIKISVYFGPNIKEVKSKLNLDNEGFMPVINATNINLTKIIVDAGLKINNYYVSGFNVGDLINSISNKFGSKLTINTQNKKIGTGVKFSYNGESAFAILYGDLNGDGDIDSADLLKIRQHLLGKSLLSGPYKEAGAVVHGDTIDSADLLRMRQHLLGTNKIKQY